MLKNNIMLLSRSMCTEIYGGAHCWCHSEENEGNDIVKSKWNTNDKHELFLNGNKVLVEWYGSKSRDDCQAQCCDELGTRCYSWGAGIRFYVCG